jgi:hypothetical protein
MTQRTSKNSKRNARRSRKRKAVRDAKRPDHRPKDISLAHVERAKANVFFSSGEVATLRHTATGWTGLASKAGTLPPKTPEMEALDRKGHGGIYWDGRYALHTSLHLLYTHAFLVTRVTS